jgi:hypothetical protein
MNREQLDRYLGALERRLRWLATLKGVAIAAAIALAATLVIAALAAALDYSPASLTAGRMLLFVAIALSIGFGLAAPLLRMNRRRTATRAEQVFPEFKERLLTFAERAPHGEADPFLELLAEDAVQVAKQSEPERVAPGRFLLALGSLSAAAVAVLVWLVTAAPGTIGQGASLLWAGSPDLRTPGLYSVEVQPGNAMVRRRADQLIVARTTGFTARQARLFARYQSTAKWEQAPMVPRGANWEFIFAGLPEDVEYYVEAGGVRSETFRLTAADLPRVKKLAVRYRYPQWLGMQPVVEDPGGDLRAVEGTVAELTIEFDKPMNAGAVVMEDGTRIELKGSGVARKVDVPIQKDGVFYIAAIEQNNPVRLTEDYFIEARKDGAPEVRISKPGRDAKVSPIEEVTVVVDASDDFGLNELQLFYSVNGGAERKVELLKQRGVKEAQGKTMIALEDAKLVPGDIVSIYAQARDARLATRTDIYFLEAQPFEREYMQSQQSGGMQSGEQGEDDQISQRQMEIIAATWNEIRNTKPDRAQAAENARFLAEMQSKLRDQSKTLVQRLRARQLSNTNQEFQSLVKDMETAAEAMGSAADHLKTQSWKEALPHEQRALQHLLRAEATRRQIQVSFGQRGQGGGGQGRDLDSLFDLELDTEKNQYETGQQASTGEQRQKDVDEALQKLEELAKRQQQLAEQQRRERQQTNEQRWQQEMLRREAEELQKQLEQILRGQSAQGSQQQGSQQQSSQQSGQSGQQSASGSQSANRQLPQRQQLSRMTEGDRKLQEAFERLQRATEDMRRATDGSSGQGDANTRRAAERLQEARDMLGNLRRQESTAALDNLADRARRLAEQQRDFEQRLRRAFGSPSFDPRNPGRQSNVSREQAEQFAREKERIAQELEQLEKEMKSASRSMAGSQPGASSRLREGLGEMQQRELGLRMKSSSNWIRQGRGQYMVPGEAIQTEGVDAVKDRIEAARSALDRNAPAPGKEGLEQSLAQVEQLRNRLQALQQGQQGQRDQQQGQGQGQSQQGQPGQQPGPGQQQGQNQQGQAGQQPGQGQPGQQGQQGQQGQSGQQPGGQQGQPGGQQAGMMPSESGDRRGSGSWQGGAIGRGPLTAGRELMNPAERERAMREAVRELSALRQALAGNPDLAREASDLLREIQRANLGAVNGTELDERLRRQVLPNVEQLELLLRRKVEEQRGGQVRSGAGEKVPPGYSNAVADYFRRLSKGKQ